MKSTIIICLTLISSVLMAQQHEGIEFREGSWKEILKMSKKEKKPIFVDAYAVWCGPCKWMAANTFTDAKVGELVNNNFIPYKFDMEKGEGVDFAKTYNVRAYPTLLFIDSEGNQIHRVVGASDAKAFLEHLKVALDGDNNLSGLERRFNQGESGKTFLKEYIDALMTANESVKEPYSKYWDLVSDEEKLSEDFYRLMEAKSRRFMDLNGQEFKFVSANKAGYESLLGKDEFAKKWYGICESSVYRVSRMEEDKQPSELKTVHATFPEFSNKIDAYYKMLDASKNNTEEKHKLMAEYGMLISNWQILNSAAWDVFENSEDRTKLEEALTWVTNSIEIEANYYNLDTRGAILMALDSAEAESALEKAIEAGKEEGQDTSATEEMLNQVRKD